MALPFNTLSRFVIAFLPRSKCLLILRLQSQSTLILESKKIKYSTVSTSSPSIFHEVMGPDAMISGFEWWNSSQLFHSPLWPSSKGSSVLLHFLPLECYHLHYLRLLILLLIESWFQLVLHPAWHFTWCALQQLPSPLVLKSSWSGLLCETNSPLKVYYTKVLFTLNIWLADHFFNPRTPRTSIQGLRTQGEVQVPDVFIVLVRSPTTCCLHLCPDHSALRQCVDGHVGCTCGSKHQLVSKTSGWGQGCLPSHCMVKTYMSKCQCARCCLELIFKHHSVSTDRSFSLKIIPEKHWLEPPHSELVLYLIFRKSRRGGAPNSHRDGPPGSKTGMDRAFRNAAALPLPLLSSS